LTNPKDVNDLALALSAANRPLFVLGGGLVTGAAQAQITALLKKVGAAAFVTYAGRGLVDPNYPLFFGSNLARGSSAQVFEGADLIVSIGTELAEVDLWRSDLGGSAKHFRIDIDPDVLADWHGADWTVLGDGNQVLSALLDMQIDAATGWDVTDIAKNRTKWRAEVEAEYPRIPTIADALKAALPQNTMIYSDMTQFAYAAKETWDMDQPGHWHHPYGFGTLGYALPAAVGGQIGRPGKPTMAIVGDYGFHYTMQELGVAVELGLPIPIILWDNGKLGAIEASMVSAQIAPNAVIARNPDFLKLAEAGPTLIYITPGLTE
jgi:acetolactate synthase-1/2/3 large subunit/5-guanidino-2-oxopentanoate decarboxylase